MSRIIHPFGSSTSTVIILGEEYNYEAPYAVSSSLM
jgi:hypothetical protein